LPPAIADAAAPTGNIGGISWRLLPAWMLSKVTARASLPLLDISGGNRAVFANNVSLFL